MESIFKGRSVEQKKWVTGGIYQDASSGKTFIIKSNGFGIGVYDFIEIIPETLCRFTGRYDKKGERIWENDTLKWRNGRKSKDEYHVSKVAWDEDYNGWKLKTDSGMAKMKKDMECEVIEHIFS